MRKKILLMFLVVSLILSVFGALNMNMIGVSAATYPSIYIEPSSIENEALTPGENFTVSIKTNYTGHDIWMYEFSLSYDPAVLEGVQAELANGDIITSDVSFWAVFVPGQFNNNTGLLGLTYAYIYYQKDVINWPVPVASGPGTLANVTFTVVSKGFSDITLGSDTRLIGFTDVQLGVDDKYYGWGEAYTIIDDTTPDPGHILHGFFINIPTSHDVAVTSLVVQTVGTVEQPVPISVNVSNKGTYDETVTLTVKNENDSALIDTTTFDLEKGLNTTESFSWDTSGLEPGSYTINATATIVPTDVNSTDNTDTKSVTLSKVHDVAVSLDVPATAAIEQPVPIWVTVSNEGSYDESVTLTVKNDSAVIDSKSFALAKGPTSKTSYFSWDTSGLLNNTSHDINATATIVATDVNSTDNTDTKSVTLFMLHDVAVTSLVFKFLPGKSVAVVGHPLPINVTVANVGSYAEDVSLTVYYDSTVIDTVLFSLAKGPTSKTSSFSWDTSGLAPSPPSYTINATATITVDNDLSDNNMTKTIDLQKNHDVAVVNEEPDIIEVPRRGNVSDTVPINVTVKNVGSYTETFNVTTYYRPKGEVDYTIIVLPNGKNYTTVTDLARTENTTILFTWNTTGVAPGFYTITAVAGLGNTDTWTGDGANTTFVTTQHPILEYTEKVYVNQILMNKSVDYTMKEYIGRIIFTTAPSVGAQITVTYTSALVNETYIDDNTETAPWTVLVTIFGDVDGDGAVGASDLSDLNEAYGSEPGDSNWDVYCDLNGDDKIDASDLFDLSKNYGGSI